MQEVPRPPSVTSLVPRRKICLCWPLLVHSSATLQGHRPSSVECKNSGRNTVPICPCNSVTGCTLTRNFPCLATGTWGNEKLGQRLYSPGPSGCCPIGPMPGQVEKLKGRECRERSKICNSGRGYSLLVGRAGLPQPCMHLQQSRDD